MKLKISLIIFSLTCVAACNVLRGDDDSPPHTIVFSAQDDNGTFQIYIMREDGSGIRQLTDGEYSSTDPAWSPDGARIAYSRSDGSTGGEVLWVMDARWQ